MSAHMPCAMCVSKTKPPGQHANRKRYSISLMISMMYCYNACTLYHVYTYMLCSNTSC